MDSYYLVAGAIAVGCFWSGYTIGRAVSWEKYLQRCSKRWREQPLTWSKKGGAA